MKKKIVCAVELSDKGKIKRMYSMKIDNYSSQELKIYLIYKFLQKLML